ncbi:hypothetical protein BST43_25210 [Mycobacteroides saopaulense]|uniref:Alkylmercury lyase n=1 Tax=Mycobacteroides saopaulense TaxID=1578165 RepID=A0A1X0IKW1_9MYCO|nr:alkylmercury lyase family protein [Mycobacteroides saopaulense]ORB48096.1 hypothetical protein BST43_25210 [Mycobacteroides saopaulense]
MNLEILQVPDCPNVAVLQDRIADALEAERVTATIVHRVIESLAAAEQFGMTGSPTLLVDGKDPFGEPGLAPAVSCRLYPAEDGNRYDGAPSVTALRAVLRVVRDNDCDATVATLGQWSGLTLPEGTIERAIHGAALRAFAFGGVAPTPDELAAVSGVDMAVVGAVLENLHRTDIIRLDDEGRIASVYPFSATATEHRVRIHGGAEVYAMCAVDALGISAMLGGRPITIDSVDHHTSGAIAIRVDGDAATADPESVVVFLGMQMAEGPLAETCCGHINFFTDYESAETWSAAHPQVTGTVLDLAAATRCGVALFGSLLTREADGTAVSPQPGNEQG